jgi:hypothetical protein
MKKINEFLKDVAKDPGSYLMLLALIVIVAASVYVIATSSAEQWRHAYCTATEAQAIECTAKGWW